MPPSGVDYASEFLNGYAPEYVMRHSGHSETPEIVYDVVHFYCILVDGYFVVLLIGTDVCPLCSHGQAGPEPMSRLSLRTWSLQDAL